MCPKSSHGHQRHLHTSFSYSSSFAAVGLRRLDSPCSNVHRPKKNDSFPDVGEAVNDFWSMSGNFIYLHHVEPRVKLYSPKEESFPNPLKYIDVSRTTHTNLDTSKRIFVVRGETIERTVDIQARPFMARTLGENGKECQAEGEAKVVTLKASS